MDQLDTAIEYLKGVGPVRGDLLRKEVGITCFADLLTYFPFRYVDRTSFNTISQITADMPFVQLKGKILNMESHGKHRTTRLSAVLNDGTGTIALVWFQGIRWVKDKLDPDQQYVVFGKPSVFNGKINIAHPEVELLSTFMNEMPSGLQPVYSSTEKLKTRGLDSRGISKLSRSLFINIQTPFPENMPVDLLKTLRLPDRNTALRNVHFPANQQILNSSRARLKFEELFFIQLRLLRTKVLKSKKIRGYVFRHIGAFFNDFYQKNLPFELTNAQKKVIKEIRKDMGSGVQMNRLLQGDVGSGKTLVALMSALIALDNGFQTAIMAPTEILANQHFETLKELTENLNIKIELLTGSTKKSRRKEIHQGLMSNEVHIITGTHALIEESVQFQNLGLVVIDEQHRFGVAQRARMWTKNNLPPHILVMTATPIPRTLSMTLYGDLDVSVIDELPPGRKAIVTRHFFDSGRGRVFAFIKEQISKGRQVYVVYPLIEESQKLDLKDLMDGYDSITRSFPLPDYAVSIVHGKMKAADKEYEMQRFVKGETQIMVSTTVIEVGVNVPNASIMIIENAERFGLSQLHQLRGRVGRGAEQSYCILMTGNKLTNEGKTRIQTMVETNDGFKISEADLKLRGPGDMMGTRQSGILEMKIADLLYDEVLLRRARDEARAILEDDPELSKNEHIGLKQHLLKIEKKEGNWGLIS